MLFRPSSYVVRVSGAKAGDPGVVGNPPLFEPVTYRNVVHDGLWSGGV